MQQQQPPPHLPSYLFKTSSWTLSVIYPNHETGCHFFRNVIFTFFVLQNGLYSSIPHMAVAVTTFTAAAIADFMVARRLKIIRVRKFMNTLSTLQTFTSIPSLFRKLTLGDNADNHFLTQNLSVCKKQRAYVWGSKLLSPFHNDPEFWSGIEKSKV